MEQDKDCISKNEVEQAKASGKKVLIVDVRSQEEYDGQHIEGSVNIPIESLPNNLDELKESHLIVTACGKGGGRSAKAVEILAAAGLGARWLCGGALGWNK